MADERVSFAVAFRESCITAATILRTYADFRQLDVAHVLTPPRVMMVISVRVDGPVVYHLAGEDGGCEAHPAVRHLTLPLTLVVFRAVDIDHALVILGARPGHLDRTLAAWELSLAATAIERYLLLDGHAGACVLIGDLLLRQYVGGG